MMVSVVTYLVGVALLLSRAGDVSGHVVSAAVLPHGSMLLDCARAAYLPPGNRTARAQCDALRAQYVSLTSLLRGSRPDLVLLSTPHGVSDLTSFAFYSNPRAAGHARTDDAMPRRYRVTLPLSVGVTRALEHVLSRGGATGTRANVTLLSGFGPPGEASEPFPLRWAEVIPAHFLLNHSGGPGEVEPQWVILSQPSRRYEKNASVGMMGELLNLGERMFSYLESIPERVSVVVSGDLAHTHRADGPYGYSPQAGTFDNLCVRWAHTLDVRYLARAGRVADQALSCGYTGLLMLHGMLRTSRLHSHTVHYAAPSYFGMMLAGFSRE